MNYAIIAAGEGSRLAEEGFTLPKPMVSLHGEMLIDRLIDVFMNNNPSGIHIIINEASETLDYYLSASSHPFPLNIIRKNTPSSLHSFHELLNNIEKVDSLCLTTTDTVFRAHEFKAFISEFESNREIDGLMAVTTFVDDESPLFVAVDYENNITAFTDDNLEQTPFVSGGIYCLRGKALAEVAASIESGTSRMRNFQRQMLKSGLKLKAHVFSKIVDIDHVVDIVTAELFLSEEIEAGF